MTCKLRVLPRTRATFSFSDNTSERFPESSNNLSRMFSFEWTRGSRRDTNYASCDPLSTCSRSSLGFAFAKVSLQLLQQRGEITELVLHVIVLLSNICRWD